MQENNTTTGPRYADLTYDAGFKAVFCDPENKEVLIKLINTFLPPERRVSEIVEYLDRELQGYTSKGKGIVMDLRCKDTKGRTFIVEMQKHAFDFFFNRCVHYASLNYSAEIKKGNTKYRDLHPVYVIALLKEALKEPELLRQPHGMVSHYTFMDVEYKNLAPDILNIIFVRLDECAKKFGDCRSEAERLCWYLKNIGGMDGRPEAMEDESLVKLFEKSEIAAFSKEKRDLNTTTI